MSWSKPFDEDELTYIEASWPRLSAAEIARRLGRSPRGVNRKIRELGLREPRARASVPPGAGAQGGAGGDAPGGADAREGADAADAQDTLTRLRELREVLRAKLVGDIDPRAIKGVSEEYRAVLAQITELEGGDGGEEGATLAEVIRLCVS